MLSNSTRSSLDELFPREPEEIISDDVRDLIELILSLIIFPLSMLGTVTNAINIRVFIQQGVTSDTSTLCLFALAVADLLGSFFLIPMIIIQIVRLSSTLALYLSCRTFLTMVFFDPHILMARVTCWITVYIAIERCLCVLLPFKVKTILRPKIAAAAMSLIYFIVFAAFVPYYLNFGIKLVYVKDYNTTIFVFTQTQRGRAVYKYTSFFFNTVMSTAAIVMTSFATALMLYKLNKYKRWRQKSASTGSAGSTMGGNANSSTKLAKGQGTKDVEMLKTVTMVTGLYVVCLSMSLLPGIVSTLVPESTHVGKNRNLNDLIYIYKYVFDAINSSLNFFFYVRISSRYKAGFNEVFSRKRTQ